MLQLKCHQHPCRSYCCQKAQRPTICALLTLLRTSSLALPQEPSPSCSMLIFGRLSFADHPRAFFSSGDFSTDLFWTTSTRFDLWDTFMKNQDGLNLDIHIFVYVYKVHMSIYMLRGGMRSWTNCFFSLTYFFFRKRKAKDVNANHQ